MRRIARSSVLVLALGASSCDEPSVGGGIERWDAVEELVLGSLDDGPTDFTEIRDIEVGSRGEMYVLEQGTREVRVFAADGAFLRRLGRGGEGPGEFGFLWRAGWKGDTLWVQDLFSTRVTLFTGRRVVGTISFYVRSPVSAGLRVAPGALLADGSVLGTVAVRSSAIAGGLTTQPLYAADRDGSDLRLLAWVEHRNETLLWGNSGRGTSDQLFSDAQLVAPAKDGGSVWLLTRSVARPPAGNLVLMRISLSGDTLLRSTIPYTPVPLTGELFEYVLGERMGPVRDAWSEQRVRRLEEAHRTRGYRPEYVPPASALVAGSDGTVWIRREDTHTDSIVWMVIDENGRPKASLTLPSDLTIHRATTSNIWGTRPGAFDVPHLVRLRVVRSPPAGRGDR